MQVTDCGRCQDDALRLKRPASLGSAPALRVAALAVRALPRRMWHAAPHDGSTLKPLSGPVLLAYARYLGLDPETEPELLHVAREALTDALPLGWERHLDATHNMPFFYCHNGGFTSWQHPQLNHYLAKIEMLRRPAARPQHKPRQSQYSPRQPSPHAAAPPQYEQYRQQAAAAAGGGVRGGLPTASARCADGRPSHSPSPQHSPAPRHSPAPSASRSSFGGGGGSSSCSSCSDGAARQPAGVARQASPSWEERWRRQQQQAEQRQLEQWQQWKHSPKPATPHRQQAPPRPLSGASWEEAGGGGAADAKAEHAAAHEAAEGEGEEEPGLG